MAQWTFAPRDTAVEFSVRHKMACWVCGHFKNVNGTIEFDPEHPGNSSVEVSIDGGELWSGDSDRDGHLKTADFLDVETHPAITFNEGTRSTFSERMQLELRVTWQIVVLPKG